MRLDFVLVGGAADAERVAAELPDGATLHHDAERGVLVLDVVGGASVVNAALRVLSESGIAGVAADERVDGG